MWRPNPREGRAVAFTVANHKGTGAPRRRLLLCACAFVALATSAAVAGAPNPAAPAIRPAGEIAAANAVLRAAPPPSPPRTITATGAATAGPATRPRSPASTSAGPLTAGNWLGASPPARTNEIVVDEGTFDIAVETPLAA